MKKLESTETMRGATQNIEACFDDRGFFIVSPNVLKSRAWNKLTGIQIDLYLWCILWSHEAETRKKPKPQEFPRDRWGDGESVRENDFYINFEKVKKCHLFNESTKTTFIRAKKRLIELGFIDCVVDGRKKKGCERSVYRLSKRWREGPSK